jgi:hypothetical protein
LKKPVTKDKIYIIFSIISFFLLVNTFFSFITMPRWFFAFYLTIVIIGSAYLGHIARHGEK